MVERSSSSFSDNHNNNATTSSNVHNGNVLLQTLSLYTRRPHPTFTDKNQCRLLEEVLKASQESPARMMCGRQSGLQYGGLEPSTTVVCRF